MCENTAQCGSLLKCERRQDRSLISAASFQCCGGWKEGERERERERMRDRKNPTTTLSTPCKPIYLNCCHARTKNVNAPGLMLDLFCLERCPAVRWMLPGGDMRISHPICRPCWQARFRARGRDDADGVSCALYALHSWVGGRRRGGVPSMSALCCRGVHVRQACACLELHRSFCRAGA